MSSVARMTLAGMMMYVTLGAAYAILGPRLQESGMASWMIAVLSLAVSVAMGGFVWRVLPAREASPGSSAGERRKVAAKATVEGESSIRAADEPTRAMIVWAAIIGFLGFSIGFFGPMVFAPSANQAPLLGIFVTGPFGAAFGAGVGWFWWVTYRGPENKDGDVG